MNNFNDPHYCAQRIGWIEGRLTAAEALNASQRSQILALQRERSLLKRKLREKGRKP